MSNENKCKRCGRKLSNPQASYGWRCAEKMGLAETMSMMPYEIFARFTEGIEKATRMFKDAFGNNPEKMKNIELAVIRTILWDGIDNKKYADAKSDLFKAVSGVNGKKTKISLKTELTNVLNELKNYEVPTFDDIKEHTKKRITSTGKKLIDAGELDDVTNVALKSHDYFLQTTRSVADYERFKKVAKDNYDSNSKIDLSCYDGKYINDQNTGEVSKLKFGNFKMGYNGCGVIAVYNALLTLDKPQDIRDIAFEFENDGKMLGGYFGTNPYAVERYFNRYNYKVQAVKGEDITEKEPPKADAYILSYWNTDDVLDGMHFTAISKNNKGEYVFYNDDVEDETEVTVSSIKNRVEKWDYQPIIMLCISKK